MKNLVIINCTLLILCFFVGFSKTAFGEVRVFVINAQDDTPIQNATVCIPEIDGYFKTNEYGYTDNIKVPIKFNTLFKEVLMRNWGEVTMIVYKESYVTHVEFAVKVQNGILRLGPTIELSKISEKHKDPFHLNVEEPDGDWVENLIEIYVR